MILRSKVKPGFRGISRVSDFVVKMHLIKASEDTNWEDVFTYGPDNTRLVSPYWKTICGAPANYPLLYEGKYMVEEDKVRKEGVTWIFNTYNMSDLIFYNNEEPCEVCFKDEDVAMYLLANIDKK